MTCNELLESNSQTRTLVQPLLQPANMSCILTVIFNSRAYS